MRELHADNASDYLVETGRLAQPVAVHELSGGVSNVVLWVEQPGAPFVLKQSRAQLRTKDAWFSDLERIYREADAMRALRPVLGKAVPEILFEDRKNYVFAMSAADPASVVWKSQLLAGQADVAVAEKAASLLATLHQSGAQNDDWRERFADQENFRQLRLDPYYRRLRPRVGDLAGRVDDLIGETESIRSSLVHADFSPKNLLVHGDELVLVDYETVHFGDPAFDLGFFLAHLCLKAIYHAGASDPFLRLISAFWETYLPRVSFEPRESLVARGLRHQAGNMLVRIDGTSPVDYLVDEEKRTLGRRYARGLLEGEVADWKEAVTVLRQQISEQASNYDSAL